MEMVVREGKGRHRERSGTVGKLCAGMGEAWSKFLLWPLSRAIPRSSGRREAGRLGKRAGGRIAAWKRNGSEVETPRINNPGRGGFSHRRLCCACASCPPHRMYYPPGGLLVVVGDSRRRRTRAGGVGMLAQGSAAGCAVLLSFSHFAISHPLGTPENDHIVWVPATNSAPCLSELPGDGRRGV